MIRGIRHIGLVVADLERALHFWSDILGFKLERKMEESGPHLDAMMGLQGVRVTTAKLLAADGTMIELLHFHSHPDRPKWSGAPYSTGLTHVALTVRDLEQTLVRLRAAGVTTPADPQMSPDGRFRVIYATGPEGVLLELVEALAP